MKHFQSYNPNPQHRRVGDCVIRAISKALNQSWDETYTDLYVQGLVMCDMPNANAVWGAYLKSKGFKRHTIPTECEDCYTVEQFCEDYPTGTYILALDSHVIAVRDGYYYDSWDSGDEYPIYYWEMGGHINVL